MVKKTLIIGNGSCAHRIAEELLATDVNIVMATTDVLSPDALPQSADKALISETENSSLEILSETKLIGCTGSVGHFLITFQKDKEKFKRLLSSVILAVEYVRQPHFSLYGLSPSSGVLSLCQIMDRAEDQSLGNLLGDGSAKQKNTIVFLTGIFDESNPVVMESVMRTALELQSELNQQTYIFAKNIKVAADGLESLYRETRRAGTVYIKFTDTLPEMRQQKDGKVRFDFLDELTGETFRLLSDITVVDETIAPSPDLKDLARLFELDTDQVGFLQTDNVHRNSIFSNRKGILIAGPARSIQSMQDQMTDAGNAAITAHGLLNEISVEPIPKAEVMSQRCIRCLTCYRLCPYRAVIKNAQITVAADACEGCGICAAECPRDAIRFQAFGSSELVDQIAAADGISGAAAFVPFLVAFCCSRSAARSRDLATCMGHKIPAGLKIIEVPCSGSVSLRHILTAFSRFADGVLVLTCHKGNCHSEYGNIYAHHRVAELAENLKAMGVEPERLTIETFASNMGLEFAEMTSTFEEKIISLGPNRLKEAAY